MNISQNPRGVSGSPLRRKSPQRVENVAADHAPASYRGRAANPPVMDESFLKMKKSCERIAAVLGIRDSQSKNAAEAPSFGNT